MDPIPWGGIGCCLSAAVLYLLGKCSGIDADALKSVKRIGHLKELAQLLEKECKRLPLVVAVSGRVGSETPISCECSGLQGVIVQQTAEQIFLKQNDSGAWEKDSTVVLSTGREVPWYLDDGTSRVHVMGAREAMGFTLTVISEVFEDSSRSFLNGTLEYLQGLRMIGVKRIERVLPTGVSLTVVGEAIKDDSGTIRIQRPHKGPFYVSQKTLDQLIAYLGNSARLYKFASTGLTVFGVYLITKHVVQYFMEGKHRPELQKRTLGAAAARSLEDDEVSNDNTNTGIDGTKRDRVVEDLCVICLEQEYNAVFLKCGHMCCCMTCASPLTRCPLCRGRIEQAVKTYRP